MKRKLLNSFLKEHAYRLSQISTGNSNITSVPMRNFLDVSVLGGWCSTCPLGCGLALEFFWRWQVGCWGWDSFRRQKNWETGTPPTGEGILILNSWSVVTGTSNDQVAGKYTFLCQRCVISLREIAPSELSEPLSYRWRVDHLWPKDKANCKASVNPQAEEFNFHRCKNHSSKCYWTPNLCKAIKI